MMDYETVIRAIVDQEEQSIGELATRKAGSLDFVSVEDGELTFTRSPDRGDVESVIDAFKEFQGKGAIGIARRAMQDILKPEHDIDLPDAIIPQSIKEERFVKSI